MIDRLLGPLRTFLDMAPERAVHEPEAARYPQLHLPLWRGREKDAPIRVLLLGGPLDRRRCRVADPFDPDIHVAGVRRRTVGAAIILGSHERGRAIVDEPVTYWYRMRRVPLTGFSLFRSAYYVGVVGEVEAKFASDLIVP